MSRYVGPSVVVDLPGGRLSHPCPADPVSVGRVLLRLTAAIDRSLLPLACWSFEVGQ